MVKKEREMVAMIIDVFEDFLDDKGIIIPNPERDSDTDPENSANIWCSDFDSLMDSICQLMSNYGIEIPETYDPVDEGEQVCMGCIELDEGRCTSCPVRHTVNAMNPRRMDEIDQLFAEIVHLLPANPDKGLFWTGGSEICSTSESEVQTIADLFDQLYGEGTCVTGSGQAYDEKHTVYYYVQIGE